MSKLKFTMHDLPCTLSFQFSSSKRSAAAVWKLMIENLVKIENRKLLSGVSYEG